MTRQQLDCQVAKGGLVRVWHGVYARTQPDLLRRLAALDLLTGQDTVASMGTAAALYGFDTENTTVVHILEPGVRTRSTKGLVVHQRKGAPLQWVASRRATAPAWTEVELARQLSRPRALATLDAALRSRWCTVGDLEQAVREQRGRRGIVAVAGVQEVGWTVVPIVVDDIRRRPERLAQRLDKHLTRAQLAS